MPVTVHEQHDDTGDLIFVATVSTYSRSIVSRLEELFGSELDWIDSSDRTESQMPDDTQLALSDWSGA